MNKKQYKEYRRNQRICYSSDDGYPYQKEDYFNRIPLQRPPSKHTDHSLLTEKWERAKREYEWHQQPGTTKSWQKDMVLVGHNNPRAAEYMRQALKNNYRCY